jgi:hypothetical protein
MQPDLRNISIETRTVDSIVEIRARHRAFPTLEGEGSSETEALAELLGLLHQSSSQINDCGRNLALFYAIFDVETLLKILICSTKMKLSDHGCVVRKDDDLVYFYKYSRPPYQPQDVVRESAQQDGLEDWNDTILIYATGRRFGERRWASHGDAAGNGNVQRRRCDRRKIDRRRHNRLKLIDQVPPD